MTAPSRWRSGSLSCPTMTSLLIKEAVNQSVDNMGFYNALNACFTLHELNSSTSPMVVGCFGSFSSTESEISRALKRQASSAASATAA